MTKNNINIREKIIITNIIETKSDLVKVECNWNGLKITLLLEGGCPEKINVNDIKKFFKSMGIGAGLKKKELFDRFAKKQLHKKDIKIIVPTSKTKDHINIKTNFVRLTNPTTATTLFSLKPKTTTQKINEEHFKSKKVLRAKNKTSLNIPIPNPRPARATSKESDKKEEDLLDQGADVISEVGSGLNFVHANPVYTAVIGTAAVAAGVGVLAKNAYSKINPGKGQASNIKPSFRKGIIKDFKATKAIYDNMKPTVKKIIKFATAIIALIAASALIFGVAAGGPITIALAGVAIVAGIAYVIYKDKNKTQLKTSQTFVRPDSDVKQELQDHLDSLPTKEKLKLKKGTALNKQPNTLARTRFLKTSGKLKKVWFQTERFA